MKYLLPANLQAFNGNIIFFRCLDHVLDEIGFMSVEAGRNWCEKATGDYKYKVEDFANLVKRYLDQKEANHHIVFLIDEIGQYIGDDSKLMLNLQTVTEDLGTSCRGKAWIIRLNASI